MRQAGPPPRPRQTRDLSASVPRQPRGTVHTAPHQATANVEEANLLFQKSPHPGTPASPWGGLQIPQVKRPLGWPGQAACDGPGSPWRGKGGDRGRPDQGFGKQGTSRWLQEAPAWSLSPAPAPVRPRDNPESPAAPARGLCSRGPSFWKSAFLPRSGLARPGRRGPSPTPTAALSPALLAPGLGEEATAMPPRERG